MVYVGLDLHKRYITACALEATGGVLAETRRLSTEWDRLRDGLAPLGAPCTVVLEATLSCWWLERQLTAAGYTVVVVHPYQVKLIWQARTKTDEIDARKLAELARVQLLPAIWIPDPATRAQRQILRGRVFLVRQCTVLKNRIHAYLTAENLRGAQADLIGPITRFASAHERAAYAGLPPSTRSSGGKTRHGHVGRGNPWLKWILIEILQTLREAPGPVGACYHRLVRAKGKPTATVAAARKFCTYLYWMMKEEWTYEEWLRHHDRLEVRPIQQLGTAA